MIEKQNRKKFKHVRKDKEMPNHNIPIENEDDLEEKHALSHPRKKEKENLHAGWKAQLLKSGRKGKLTNYARAI